MGALVQLYRLPIVGLLLRWPLTTGSKHSGRWSEHLPAGATEGPLTGSSPNALCFSGILSALTTEKNVTLAAYTLFPGE